TSFPPRRASDIGGLVLAPEDRRDPRREPADDLVLGIDDVPLTFDVGRLGAGGFKAVGVHNVETKKAEKARRGRSIPPAHAAARADKGSASTEPRKANLERSPPGSH